MKYQSDRQKQQNNKGFTIVELLLSIMILTIVSSAVFSFMIMGGRMFNRSNEEVDMQSEAHILKNYMNELITDAAKYVTFVEDGTQGALYGARKCLTIYGGNSVSFMAWFDDSDAETENQVRYYTKDVENMEPDEEGKYNITLTGSEADASKWSLLAEGVTKFDCSTTNLKEEHRIFSAELGFENGRSSYETTHTITLRNDIFYKPAEGGEGEDEGDVQEEYIGLTKINQINLVPSVTDRSRGSSVQYTHTVIGVGNISKDVNYRVEGGTSAATRMDGNILHIGADETASILTVVCQSVTEPDVSASAIVSIASISSITITPDILPNYKSKYYYTNTNINFTAFVEGDYISQSGSGVTWSLTDSKNTAKILNTTATTCMVNTGSEMNQVITLKATSNADSSISKEYTIQTADIEIDELYIAAKDGEYTIKRGSDLQLQVLENGAPVSGSVSWSLFDNPLSDEVKIDNNGKITASADINYSKGYSVGVQAVVNRDGAEETITCAVTMDPVKISFDPTYVVVVAGGAPSRVTINVEGLNVEDEELNIQQKPYVRGLTQWSTKGSGDSFVLGLSMSDGKPATEYSALKVSLKGHSSVSAELKSYYYKYNMSYNGKNVYVPVPGDELNLIKDENNDKIPDTSKETTIAGIKYGYTNVTLNGVVYHYYVDKRPGADPAWFVRVGSGMAQYKYNSDEEMEVYEKYTPVP